MTPPEKTYAGRWRTLAVLCLSLVVITIDSTIVSVALPTMGRELGATTGELQWFVDGYTLAITGLLLLAGAVGDRFGRHRVLAGGLAVFAVGSVFAALSSTSEELIVARVVMGAGAAAIMPATLSIIIDVFSEPVERAQAIAIWAGMSGVGVALGPTLGGWLLDHFEWGSVFIVNLPVVAAALLTGRRFVPASRAAHAPRLDLVGGALAGVGLTALTWGIIAAPDHGWLSGTTLAVGGAAALVLGAFLWWEVRTAEPMMDLRLFRDRRFSAGSLAITVVFFVLFGTLFGYTQILQLVLGHSPLVAGVCAIPMAVALGVSAPLSAAVVRALGTKVPVAGGLLVMAVGVWLLATATPSTGLAHYAITLALMGAGMGFAIAPSTESIMASVPPGKAGVGSAVNDTTRELGGVLGVAVLGSLLASAYSANVSHATDALDPTRAAAAESSIGGALSVAQRLDPLAGQALAEAARDAFMAASERGCLVAAAIAVAGAAAVARWLPSRQPALVPGAASHADAEGPAAVPVTAGRVSD